MKAFVHTSQKTYTVDADSITIQGDVATVWKKVGAGQPGITRAVVKLSDSTFVLFSEEEHPPSV